MSEENNAQQADPQQAQQTDPQQAQPQPQTQVPNAYEAIIEQQQQQIAALIEQTNAQSAQIASLVQNGAQFTQVQQAQQAQQAQPVYPDVQFPNVYQPIDVQAHPNANWQPPSMLDADMSLESLGKEIGKPPAKE